jgi:predicted nucleic acid-binding protein
MRVYLDTNVFIYAVGGDSPHRAPSRAILRGVAERHLDGETSAYALQEMARQRLRRGDVEMTKRIRETAALCSAIHPLDWDVVATAMDVADRHQRLGVADAVHVATAMRHGIATFVSADQDLDGIPGIERVDPLDGVRLAALMND